MKSSETGLALLHHHSLHLQGPMPIFPLGSAAASFLLLLQYMTLPLLKFASPPYFFSIIHKCMLGSTLSIHVPRMAQCKLGALWCVRSLPSLGPGSTEFLSSSGEVSWKVYHSTSLLLTTIYSPNRVYWPLFFLWILPYPNPPFPEAQPINALTMDKSPRKLLSGSLCTWFTWIL